MLQTVICVSEIWTTKTVLFTFYPRPASWGWGNGAHRMSVCTSVRIFISEAYLVNP